MDIGSLLNQAGGVSTIARQLGVDEATVERGAGALLPHVANGVETQGLPGSRGCGLPRYRRTWRHARRPDGRRAAAECLAASSAAGVGNEILGHIFGSKDTSREVATQASQQSGVDSSVLKKLLPIVAGAVAMHYMTKGRHRGAGNEGGGGILGGILGGL